MEKTDIIITSVVFVIVSLILGLSYYINKKIDYHSAKFSSRR